MPLATAARVQGYPELESPRPGGSFAALWELPSDEIRAMARQLFEAHARVLEKIVAIARSEKTLRPDGESDQDLSIWIASTLQGALATARIMQDADWFGITVRQLEQALFR